MPPDRFRKLRSRAERAGSAEPREAPAPAAGGAPTVVTSVRRAAPLARFEEPLHGRPSGYVFPIARRKAIPATRPPAVQPPPPPADLDSAVPAPAAAASRDGHGPGEENAGGGQEAEGERTGNEEEKLGVEQGARLDRTSQEGTPDDDADEEDDHARDQPPRGWYCFFDLPPEIREMIYDHALDLPDLRRVYARFYERFAASRRGARHAGDGPTPPAAAAAPAYPRPVLRTPTVLLLCRAVTREALPTLHARTLVVDRPPPWVSGMARPLLLSDFVGHRTLQALRRIDLRVSAGAGRLGSAWAWIDVFNDLVGALQLANALVDLRVVLRRCNPGDVNLWRHEMPYYRDMIEKLNDLEMFNPNVTRPGRIRVEQWHVLATEAWRLDPAVPRRIPGDEPDRRYPDPEMWPGEIFEFI